MVGAPADKPNAWILGWENTVGGGDTDHNDLVFIIERETGGSVKLNKPIEPETTNTNINGVTIGVWDEIPGGACAGEADITYWLSINNGANWVVVDGWDEVYNFTLVDDTKKVLGEPVTNWIPGTPALTYRTRRVDFTGEGGGGRRTGSGRRVCSAQRVAVRFQRRPQSPQHAHGRRQLADQLDPRL